MARKVIAQQGSAHLVVLDDAISSDNAIAVVVVGGALAGGSAPLQSFLARGYWEAWSGTEREEREVIRAIPDPVPVAVCPPL